MATRPLAVVTGASTGIGLGIARALARADHDLVIAADEPAVGAATEHLEEELDVEVRGVQVDLAGREGVVELAEAVTSTGRPVEVLVLNAGVGVNGRFVDTDVEEHLRVVGVNVTGAVHLAGLLLPAMVARGSGRLLVTSSIVDVMVGPQMSTYNASKSFMSSWAEALRLELVDSGVTVTTLKPGATDTAFFARSGMEDTTLAARAHDDPDEVGRQAVAALLAGEAEIVGGPVLNRVLHAAAGVLPDRLVGRAVERAVEDGDP